MLIFLYLRILPCYNRKRYWQLWSYGGNTLEHVRLLPPWHSFFMCVHAFVHLPRRLIIFVFQIIVSKDWTHITLAEIRELIFRLCTRVQYIFFVAINRLWYLPCFTFHPQGTRFAEYKRPFRGTDDIVQDQQVYIIMRLSGWDKNNW